MIYHRLPYFESIHSSDSNSFYNQSGCLLITSTLDYVLTDFWNEHSDPTTVHLPLISNGPWKIMGIVCMLFITRFSNLTTIYEESTCIRVSVGDDLL